MDLTEPEILVELDWLLGLPLEAEALQTLWSALQNDLAAQAPQSAESLSARAALAAALETQQLLSLRSRCLDGDWLTALPPLLALLQDKRAPDGAEACAWCLELLQELHFRLLDPNAPSWDLAADERAELLWLGHALLEQLEPLSGQTPERLPVVIEQLSRYGAIAWMEKPGPEARARAIRLLLRLAWINPESRPWSLPALRNRLDANLEDPQTDAGQTEGPAAPWLQQAITALAGVDPAILAVSWLLRPSTSTSTEPS